MTLDFPPIIEFVKNNSVFVLIPIIIIMAGIYQLGKCLKQNIFDKRLPMALVATFMGISIVWGIMEHISTELSLRNIEIENINGLEIEKINSENDDNILGLTEIYNKSVIDEGLKKLSNSKSYSRNHEHFIDGYRMQLIINNIRSGIYINAYRKSSKMGNVDVVTTFFKNGIMGKSYQNKQFLEWVKKEIDPLFAEIKPGWACDANDLCEGVENIQNCPHDCLSRFILPKANQSKLSPLFIIGSVTIIVLVAYYLIADYVKKLIK